MKDSLFNDASLVYQHILLIIIIIIIFLNLGMSSRGGRKKLILEIITLMVNHNYHALIKIKKLRH